MTSVNLVPTQCPKFLAACMTCGIELESGTPGISNTYSKGKKYEPGEPGEIHYYLSNKQGLNPLAIAKVWHNPEKDLEEASGLEQRLLSCKDGDAWEKIAGDIDTLIVCGAVALMSRFAAGKVGINNEYISDEEEHAAKCLSDIPGRMRAIQGHHKRPGGQIAADLSKYWEPAMFAWLKAWIHNYRIQRHLWQKAHKAIKIEREGNPFPLVIPATPKGKELLRKWT